MTSRFAEFESIDSCPGCGSYALCTAHAPDISQCRTCSLLFRNPRPTQAEIARSYDTGDTFKTWQEEEPVRARMWDRRAAIIRRFQPRGTMLDVGTGDGRFLRTCRELGYDVVGTEVSEAGASYARKDGFDVKMGQITDVELARENFDVVTIWHVLEHVPEPRAVLRKVHSLLRPNGILAIAVPNEENFFVRRRLRIPNKTSPFDPLQFGGEIHLTYFRPATLSMTLQLAGFKVIEFGVDDIYHQRDLKMHLKLSVQRLLAKTLHWHFAVAMYAVCRRA